MREWMCYVVSGSLSIYTHLCVLKRFCVYFYISFSTHFSFSLPLPRLATRRLHISLRVCLYVSKAVGFVEVLFFRGCLAYEYDVRAREAEQAHLCYTNTMYTHTLTHTHTHTRAREVCVAMYMCSRACVFCIASLCVRDVTE